MTNPIIKVYSFGRSGTHWFMSLLKNRFYKSVKIGQGITSDTYSFSGWDSDSYCDWGCLLGGHWQHPKYAPTLENSVYLIRDGKDVMASWWKMRKIYLKKEDLTLAEAMCERREDNPSNPAPKDIRTATQWFWSTRQWLKCDIPVFSYEDLMVDKDKELDRMASLFGLIDDQVGKPDSPVGYSPGVPKVGKWKEYFTDDDLKLFNECREESQTYSDLI